MKRQLSVLLAGAMLMTTLVGCGGGTDSADAAGEGADSALSIDVAFGPAIDTPYGQAHEHWKEILEEQSDGSMTLNVFPSDQLGSTKDAIDQCLTGDAVITSTDASYFADLGVKDLMICQAPFLCQTWEQVDKLYASDWFEEQKAELENYGIKVLAANWRYGDRNLLTKKKVESPADIAGMKIRVPQSTVYVKAFESIGATPTPMALGDVYTALQQGTIDGLENPLSTIYTGKYQEVAKYLLLDAHMKTINLVVCGLDFYNSLSAEQQQLLTDTAVAAGEYQNELAAELDEELIQSFKDEGCTVTEINYDEWKQAAESFYAMPEFSDWTPELYERIQEIING